MKLKQTYSVDYAIAFNKPHDFKEYAIALREWIKQPYNVNDNLPELAKQLDGLLPKGLRSKSGEWTTQLILEVHQKDKLKANK